MNILILVDKLGTAIDRLSQLIKVNNPHLDITVLPLHPKRPDIKEIEAVVAAYDKCDILHVAYWKSGEKLKEYIDISSKPKILCHYNPYDAVNEINQSYDMVVVGNETIHAQIPYARLIPYGLDLDQWTYNEDYTTDKTVSMTVGRIESKKGVLEVAQVCKELGYKFILAGRISDAVYFDEIMKANPETDFRQDITDEQLSKVYFESAIHVCNSTDNFESGTLPMLEAMATGVPVLTRAVGHVPELNNGANMIVRKGIKEDLEDLKKELKDLMENPMLRHNMREKAWETVKNRNAKKMARQFEYNYYTIIKRQSKYPNDPFVSVIVPTRDRADLLATCLSKIVTQTYHAFEIIVSDSSEPDVAKDIKGAIDYLRAKVSIPIKYIHFPNNGEYTLAKARNLACMESNGDLLVFCDDRIGMEPGAIEAFARAAEPRIWFHGMKDGYEKGFVENFSAITRSDFIVGGMFNERMDVYGGMTQEVRERYRLQGIDFVLLNTAKAMGIKKTKSKALKRKDIQEAKFKIYKLYGSQE